MRRSTGSGGAGALSHDTKVNNANKENAQPPHPPNKQSLAQTEGKSVVSSSTRARQEVLGGQVSSTMWPSAASLWVPSWQEPCVNLFNTLQIHRLAQILERKERLGDQGDQTTQTSSDHGDRASSKDDKQSESGASSSAMSKMSHSLGSPEWAAKHVMRKQGNVIRTMVRGDWEYKITVYSKFVYSFELMQRRTT